MSPRRPWTAAAAAIPTPAAGSVALALVLAVAPAFAAAQAAPGPATTSGEATRQQPPVTVSPRGAFLRALALPGWGHAAIGSHTRGAFYFAAEGLTAYSLLQARGRLSDTRERAALREAALLSQLAREGVTDPLEIDERLASDADLAALRELEDARGEQQEDLVAFGLFLVFLSGADAYVSAHLSRFPEPLTVEATPVGDGRMEVAVRLWMR